MRNQVRDRVVSIICAIACSKDTNAVDRAEFGSHRQGLENDAKSVGLGEEADWVKDRERGRAKVQNRVACQIAGAGLTLELTALEDNLQLKGSTRSVIQYLGFILNLSSGCS